MSKTIEERIAALEQGLEDLKDRELTDLKKKVDGIDRRTWAILVSIVTLLATLMGALLVKV